MLTKEEISFPMNYHDLPVIQGFVVDMGEHKGQPFTALWEQDSESNCPEYFWAEEKASGYILAFIDGLKAAEEAQIKTEASAYQAGRQAGIALVKNGLAMVFGTVGRSYIQQIVNEMDRDNV